MAGAAGGSAGSAPSFLDRGDVHEHILTAVIGMNESITLCRVGYGLVPTFLPNIRELTRF
jgi:hypothetical protein